MSRLLSKLKELEKELNETHNLKRRFPPFPLEIKLPYSLRKGSAVFYQKNIGFRIWGPNHYTRASLITSITPICAGNSASNCDTNIRTTTASSIADANFWNIRVGDGVGTTTKQDTTLKGTAYQADSGTSARIDVSNSPYYQRQFSAVYNAGTLPSGYVIREVGLFSRALYSGSIAGQSFSSATEYLVARLSTSDGDFEAYTPNTSLPLTVNWIIQWSL